MDAGRIDEALAQFERGREVEPGFGGNYRAIGVVHVTRGEIEEAIPLFKRAAVLDPLDHFAFIIKEVTFIIVPKLRHIFHWIPYSGTIGFEHDACLLERADFNFVASNILRTLSDTLLTHFSTTMCGMRFSDIKIKPN